MKRSVKSAEKRKRSTHGKKLAHAWSDEELAAARFEYHQKSVIFGEDPHCSEVSIDQFYEFLFGRVTTERMGHQEDQRPNLIVHYKRDGKEDPMLTQLLFSTAEFKKFRNYYFAIVSPCTYYSTHSTLANVRELCGFTIDLDGVKPENLSNLLMYFDKKTAVMPIPSAIVNSGTGVHLYYVLETPIKTYKSVQKYLQRFKDTLTKMCWNNYTSSIHTDVRIDPRQYESIVQGYRIIGSDTKLAYRGDEGITVRAYAYDGLHYVTLDYLNAFMQDDLLSNEEMRSSILTNEKLTPYPMREPEKFEKWKEAGFPVRKKVNWQKHDGLYRWWLRIFPSKCYSGHRYWCCCILAALAYKCGISKEQLTDDAYNLFEILEQKTIDPDNHFEYSDIDRAINSYYKKEYLTLSRSWAEKGAGFDIPRAKRNGRSQTDHLILARTMQKAKAALGENVLGGRPEHSGEKKEIVREWRKENPDGSKLQCAKATGLSRTTVIKWWSCQ